MFLILSIIFTSLLCIGATIATQKGMVFFSFRENLEEKANGKRYSIYDAVLLCHWCMPSIWTVAGYFFSMLYLESFDFYNLLFYPICVCASSILNGIIWGLHNKLY